MYIEFIFLLFDVNFTLSKDEFIVVEFIKFAYTLVFFIFVA